MGAAVKNRFSFSDHCYYDPEINTIVDTDGGRVIQYTVLTGSEGAVLKMLIQAHPGLVSNEALRPAISAACDDNEVRRVISDLKKRHEQLRLWIPRARDGSYCLRAPAVSGEAKPAAPAPLPSPSCVLKSTGICVRPNFVREARLDTFAALDDAFAESHVVFLQGIGGIGKSEAAKHWALQKKKEGLFDTVVFAQINAEANNGSIPSLIADDTIFVLSGAFRSRDEDETTEAYFHRKLAKIKQITDERALLIIDNYDMDDPQLATLFTGPYRLLVTTRNRQTGYDFPLIPVTEIQEPEHLKDIFFKNLGDEREDIDREDPYIGKLFALVSNHTLTIEIIAKSLINSVDTPETLYQKIGDPEQHTLMHHVDGLVERNFSEEPMTPFECIRRLFNLSRLEQDKDFEYKSQVLVFLAAMPTRGIELSLFKKWSDNHIIRAKNSLVQKSWLRQDTANGTTLISMHPLIREIVWYEMEPTPDKCETILNGLVRVGSSFYHYLHHQPKTVKDIYEQIALSLITAFPFQDLKWFDFYSELIVILSNCANADAALCLANDLQLFLTQKNLTTSWQFGLIHFHIGLIYSAILWHFDEAMYHLQTALAIMESTAQTNADNMWLSFLYREIVRLRCKSNFLVQPYDAAYVDATLYYLTKGEKLAAKLHQNGFVNTTLDIYYGTLCIFRSKLAIYRGSFDEAAMLLDIAESEFNKFGYPNTLDKSAIASIRSSIYEATGSFSQQLVSIQEAAKVFEDSYGKYHRISIRHALRLATAYQNNGQPEEAIRVLAHYLKIAEEMLGNDAALTATIRKQLQELTQP